ncbi:DMT family transporter [Defluviimonas aestuarii]|uniref:DMT family transporter n=1 Tax=Albidovulum aestuarii TaxID=1130726 RepID=UPI00249CF115|nr:DMT family transporter [Defluviimonas aestuarii]MDI3335394.1 DMT family transporter [Defluviimonas aestuarii]
MIRHPLFGLGLAAFGALILTPDTMFMRWSGLEGFAMLAWRGLLMGSLLIAVWFVTARTRRRDLRAMMCVSGFGVMCCQAVNGTLFSLGIAHAPVAIVLFGVATMPVFSALLSRWLSGEQTRGTTWIAMAAVMGGIAIAVFGDGAEGLGFNRASLLGALAGLGVAAMLALGFVLMRRARDLPLLPTIGTGALMAGTIGFALSPVGTLAAGNVWAIAVTGAVILPVSFLALSYASRHTEPANVSLLMLLETVLGPAWVWAGAGEAMTVPMMLGGAVVVTSLALYILATGRRSRTPPAGHI